MSQEHNFHVICALFIYLKIDLNDLFPLSRIESFIVYKINSESKAEVLTWHLSGIMSIGVVSEALQVAMVTC